MSLSSDLLSQFVKITKDTKPVPTETTVYGTVKTIGDRTYVQLDGSDLLTPVSTTVDIKVDERVTVMIKNHTATVTGNLSSPAARTEDVQTNTGKINDFDIVMAYKVTTEDLEAANGTIESLVSKLALISKLDAVSADIETLQAKFANLEYVRADDVKALNATIESLEATFGTFEDISTEDLEALNAEITNLKGYTADFTYVSSEVLDAVVGRIKNLDVQYAKIDFANIGEAAFIKIFSESGLINDLVVGNQTITGELVGVTIKGDRIEGGTIVADKLVVKDSKDGLYYKLNFESGAFTNAEEVPLDQLHGSVIAAKSITAEKISVKDLVAFGATIGSFNIGDKSLYSGVKSGVDSSSRGVYMDTNGQFNFGDAYNFVRYIQVAKAVATVSNKSLDVVECGDVPNLSAYVENDILHVVDIEESPTVDVLLADGVLSIDGNTYKLEISAESIVFGDSSRSSAADLKKLTEHVKIGTVIDEETGDEKPCVELAEGDSDFKQVITNTKTQFLDGAVPKTTIDKDGVNTDNLVVNNEFRQGGFVWASRPNGNYGLSWVKGVTS